MQEDKVMSKNEQKLEFEHATIYQTNENCQVFNGPISGAIFAMPGSTVHQHVGNAEKETENTAGDKVEETEEKGAAGGEETNCHSACFKFSNDFTRERVAVVVKEFYHGSTANLALIEIVLYDHGQLKKRNAHTAFLKALMAWGIIEKTDDKELKKVSNGMAAKMRSLPPEGYLGWKDKGCVNDRGLCIDIGKQLGDTMRYGR